MAWWNIGDEELNDPRFLAVGPAGFALYHMAGIFCLAEVRGRPGLPDEWFVPEWFIRGQPSGRATAKKLADVGLWKRVSGGYLYAWIRPSNTADAVAKRRKYDRDYKAQQGDDDGSQY